MFLKYKVFKESKDFSDKKIIGPTCVDLPIINLYLTVAFIMTLTQMLFPLQA